MPPPEFRQTAAGQGRLDARRGTSVGLGEPGVRGSVLPARFPLGGPARALERDGKWRDLLLLLGAWLHDGREGELPPRWLAGAARAQAFLGRAESAAKLLARFRELPQEDLEPEARCVAWLADAALMRQAHRWKMNETLAQQALCLALEADLLDAEADARFAMALSWAEGGRWAKALDAFQGMRSDPRPLSPYRRGLAAMNEGWTLWDSGQPELLAELVPALPPAYRAKPEVFVAAWEDRTGWLRERIGGGFAAEISLGDEIQIAMILCEWQSLAGDDRVPEIERSWLYRRVGQLMDNASDLSRRKLAACRSLLVGESVAWPEDGLRDDAVLYLELANLSAIAGAALSPEAGREAYVGCVLPLLKEQRVRSPLLPTLAELRAGSSGWARRLAVAIGLADAGAARSAPTPKLEFGGWTLRRADPPSVKQISFEKSPASRLLLLALAGRSGRSIRKEDLHFRLTGTPYRKRLHDARLHKLLKRLSDRIEESFGVKPWTMPGDNTVELTADLEAK